MTKREYICGILAFVAIFLLIGFAGHVEHNYTRKDCEVVKVSGGVVTVEDKCGYLWEFEGTGYDVGVHLDVKMHTNFTHGTIADDYITGIK